MKNPQFKRCLAAFPFLFLALCPAYPVLAQNAFSFDLQAGITISPAFGEPVREFRSYYKELSETLEPDSENSVTGRIGPRPALCYGANLHYQLNEKIVLRTGFVISPRGYRTVIKEEYSNEGYQFDSLEKNVTAVQLRYLDLPLVGAFRLGGHFEVSGGLVISRRISAVSAHKHYKDFTINGDSYDDWSVAEREKYDLSPLTRPFRVGLQLGVSTVDLQPFDYELRIQRSNRMFTDPMNRLNDLTIQFIAKISLI